MTKLGVKHRRSIYSFTSSPHTRRVKSCYQNADREMLAHNIISDSCSPYAAPVVIVPKKNRESRFCIDYRKSNKQTVKDKSKGHLRFSSSEKCQTAVHFPRHGRVLQTIYSSLRSKGLSITASYAKERRIEMGTGRTDVVQLH